MVARRLILSVLLVGLVAPTVALAGKPTQAAEPKPRVMFQTIRQEAAMRGLVARDKSGWLRGLATRSEARTLAPWARGMARGTLTLVAGVAADATSGFTTFGAFTAVGAASFGYGIATTRLKVGHVRAMKYSQVLTQALSMERAGMLSVPDILKQPYIVPGQTVTVHGTIAIWQSR